MSSVIQTMNVRTPCIAGSLLQLIAITTLQSAYLCIVKAETPFSGGIRLALQILASLLWMTIQSMVNTVSRVSRILLVTTVQSVHP